MGQRRLRRPEQQSSQARSGAPDTASFGRRYRPRLEWLEDRVQPGDTILGLSAVALWGLGSNSLDVPLALKSVVDDQSWHDGLYSRSDFAASASAISLMDYSLIGEAGYVTSRNLDAITPTVEMAAGLFSQQSASDDLLASHMAAHRLAGSASLPPQPPAMGFATGGGGNGTALLGAGVPSAPVAPAVNGNAGGSSSQLFAAAPPLSFNVSTGQLAIRPDAGNQTVREAPTARGFVDVTLDGHDHSSDPGSAFFDRKLAGASSTTVTGIRFAGSGQDTLTVGSQQLAGGFTVQATGGTVITENVSAAGSLTIQAPNITINGSVQGSSVSLAAAGWVNLNAAGRIDATGRAGGANPLMEIDVSAGVFVNSGQLHVDGATGGQINIQGGNILNAGPITADSTGVDATGGQVHIAFTGAYIATTAAVTSTSSTAGTGGQLTIDGGRTGRLYSSGSNLAMGLAGGAVDLFGRDVILSGATADASGDAGGGSVRLGGDFGGGNLDAIPANTVTVTPASTIRADALRNGSGGQVFVWAEQTTAFNGTVSARGGPAGGSGGLIDLSGRGDLNYGGAADASAPLGKSGTLLLDPKNITISDALVGVFPQYDLIDPHPTVGGTFGGTNFPGSTLVLSNGNVLVPNTNDDFGGSHAGALYLFDGRTGALLSSLVGSSANEQVGNYILPLRNGNYVVETPNWNANRGAATWGSATAGVSGVVSVDNSLVGSSSGDQVGWAGYVTITTLSNGNYVVQSPNWNGGRGAVTLGNGDIGIRGTISEANSLVGSQSGDRVGWVIPLSNGNYVVQTPNWNSGRGAVTWASGTQGITGIVSAENSLVGSNPGDQLGFERVSTLRNGNYVVLSRFWNNGRGAATWGSGSAGVTGVISAANSLVGSTSGDWIGGGVLELSNGNYVITSRSSDYLRAEATWADGSTGITGVVSAANSLVGYSYNIFAAALANGNYVVGSQNWNNSRGAVTWGNGATGTSGTVSAENSLVGSNPGDLVSQGGSFAALSNGNYVVSSAYWNGDRGAVTWGSGETGIRGVVSVDNSLVGSNPGDEVGENYISIIQLANGNYVVGSPNWNGKRGAVTWGNAATGITGVVSTDNSLVGSNPNEQLGYFSHITPLSNGNYVVSSYVWNGDRGAVTWADGSTGVKGTISEANSLVGSNPDDYVGGVTALSNGNYAVSSPSWNGKRGAVTWGSGTAGVSGPVSEANSLVGANSNDYVGSGVPGGFETRGRPGLVALSNGNYVVISPFWNGGRGAVTWANGNTAVSGTVSEVNSLVGSDPGDEVGGGYGFLGNGIGGITALYNGNYVVASPEWNSTRGAQTWGNGDKGVHGTVSAANSVVGANPGDYGGNVTALGNGDYVVVTPSWNSKRGAATWVRGTSGETLDSLGTITPQNSLLGTVANAGLAYYAVDNRVDQTFLATFSNEGGGRVTVGLTDPSQLTYATAQSQPLAITSGFLIRTLDTGTAVGLQASNDIIVNSPITVSAGGNGGALTLQAGRSILLNAGITTDKGALTLIANDQRGNGVVDSQRDPGNAVITMAGGTTLDTGSAPLIVELRDGAGLSNRDSGAITLQAVTAGSVSAVNNGPNAGSDVNLGSVTTSGTQTYSDPNGITNVTGNLSAADNPITFASSVVVSDGVTVDAGASTVNFASSGTQTLQSGVGSSFVNVNHTGTGTLQLTSGLTVTGSLTNSAGIFDANNQPVAVTGEATVAGGTYLAGTAPQTFSGGLSITGGVFSSSSGPLTVNGPIAVLGGQLNAAGMMGPVTSISGLVTPGGASPGVLSVAGPVTFFSSTTLSILCNGPMPGSDYSQLQASGPITLANSNLSLVFGFQPPVGSSFEILTNTGSGPITGRFNGLDEGAIFSQGSYQFQITYQGGTGGDSVMLTRVA